MIDDLLISNIKKSFCTLKKGVELIPDELIEFDNKTKINQLPFIISPSFAKIRDKPLPWFYNLDGDKIRSPQETFFGIYCIGNIFRGILMSYPYFSSGEILLKKGHISPSILLYYTSFYHLSFSYYALNKKVFLKNILGKPKLKFKENSCSTSYSTPEKYNNKSIIASLNKENYWVFNLINQSHIKHWNIMKDILLTKELIDEEKYLLILLDYLTKYHPSEYISEFDKENKQELLENIDLIPKMRHRSIYDGQGYDEFVVDSIRDGEYIKGLDFKANTLRNTLLNYLNLCSVELLSILEKLEKDELVIERNIKLLKSIIFYPDFDLKMDEVEFYKENDLTKQTFENVIEILEWVYKT